MSKSNIEWTQDTWNPIVGCSILSPGCSNCYAMTMAARIEAMNAEARETEHASGRKRTIAAQYDGTTRRVNGNAVWTGKLALAPESTLLAPLKRKRPTTYFVNSMGDLFHEDCSDAWIDRVFAVMALCPQHTFQVLTKRAERMQKYVDNALGRVIAGTAGDWPGWPLPNVWLGVSTERQKEADERIPELLATPAAVRFISAEPLLGPIDLSSFPSWAKMHEGLGYKVDALSGTWKDGSRRLISTAPKLDWVIVGGESGPGSRPMHPDWARSLRDQCAAANVPFFFKQWGEYLPVGQSLPGCGTVHGATAVKPGRMKLHYGGTPKRAPKHAFAEHGVEFASMADDRLTFRVGKKAAGRLLDGIEHDAMPTDHRLTPANREQVPA